MIDLFQQIKSTIDDHCNTTNDKIRGTLFLEILKQKLLNNIKENSLKTNQSDLSNEKLDYFFEKSDKKIQAKLLFCSSPKVFLNHLVLSNFLLVSLREKIIIDIEDHISKKNANIILPQNTGITIPKNSKCNFNYIKDSIVLEINLDEIDNSIENFKKETI